MGEIWICRINFRECVESWSAGLWPALALVLDVNGEMRGGAPRSNLQTAACIQRIDSERRRSVLFGGL